jgi:BirA family biotin operon repressor/biotin-[acetyl-CoA-carboxylase] ligase
LFKATGRISREMKSNKQREPLSPETIRRRLGESLFSKNMLFREAVNSTNVLAKELALTGAPDGTIVLAEEQTAGKGRRGRRWISPGYKDILCSLLLRPALPVKQVFVLTMILAVAVIEGIRAKTSLNVMIKWPNDLYIDHNKLGGILTEFSQKDGLVEYVILGLGLNVNGMPEEEEGLLNPATSVLKETGGVVSRNDLIVETLIRFDGYYRDVLAGRIEDLYKKWNGLSVVLGEEVHIESQGGEVEGTALRIDQEGAMIIRRMDGREQRILSGDVSLRF